MSSTTRSIFKYTNEKYNKSIKEYKDILNKISPYIELLLINQKKYDISINFFDKNCYLLKQWGSTECLNELSYTNLVEGVCWENKFMGINATGEVFLNREYSIIDNNKYIEISVPINDRKDKLLSILTIILINEEENFKYYESLLHIKNTLEKQLRSKNKIEYSECLKQKVQKREKLFMAVMENFNMAVMIVGYPSLRIQYINNPSIKLIDGVTGVDIEKDDLYGISLYDIEKSQRCDIINHTIDSIRDKNFETLSKSKLQFQNGTKKIMKFSRIPIYDEDENIKSVVITGMDITEESEFLNTKNKFFSLISHELRSPANIIISASQLLLTDKYKKLLSKNVTSHIEMMKINSYRLLRLINNFLDIEKFQAGFLELDMKNYDIVHCTEELTNSIIDLTDSKGIEVIFDTEFEEKIVALDIDKYERIILNLLSNATKFTPEGGQILVNLYEGQEHLVVSVKDTGIGIKKENIPKIFNKFNSIKYNLPRVDSGTGLGLNLVKNLMEKMNGIIKVDSNLGKGTEFKLFFPNIKLEDEELGYVKRTQKEIEHITNIEFSDIK